VPLDIAEGDGQVVPEHWRAPYSYRSVSHGSLDGLIAHCRNQDSQDYLIIRIGNFPVFSIQALHLKAFLSFSSVRLHIIVNPGHPFILKIQIQTFYSYLSASTGLAVAARMD